MPDNQGRYSLLEMRFMVWEDIAATYPTSVERTAGPTFGEPSLTLILNPLYPKTLIDRLINQSLTSHFIDLSVSAPNVFADSELVDLEKDVREYPLPLDMAFLRSLWWKDPDTRLTIQPPVARDMMHYLEPGPSFADIKASLGVETPTYYRQLNQFVLNDYPTKDNEGGVEVRYIKWINFLATDSDIVESEYARLLQEIIVLDAAIAAVSRRQKTDVTELRQDLTRWEQRLIAAAGLSTSAPFKQLTFYHPMTIGDF